MSYSLRIIAAVLAAGLASCKVGGGGGGGGVHSGCVGSFLGGRIQNSIQVCNQCRNAQNPRRAIDGDRETSADYAYGGGSTAGIDVFAQDGVVFPGGNFAGAIMAIPAEYTGTSWAIATFLDGAPQETLTPANDAGGDLAQPSGLEEYYGFTTTLPFDEVRISLNGGAPGLDPVPFRVFEVCGEQ